MPPSRATVKVLTLAAVLCGCASKSFIPPGTVCEIGSSRAQFYKYGPAQTFGADESLPPGTRVTIVERDFGFSRVMLANGLTGYVSTDDLKPLPPEPNPATKDRVVTNRKLPRLFSAPIKRSDVKPTPGEPLFDINDVPLPMSDTPSKPQEKAEPKPE